MALATDIEMSKDCVSYRYGCLKMALATDIDVYRWR